MSMLYFVKKDRMTEHKSLLDNLDNIKECLSHKNSHTFCVDCLETKNFDEDPCQLCRPFYAISDIGCGGYSREYLMEKLMDLHQLLGERNLIVAEKKIDIPLLKKVTFCATQDHDEEMLVTWLDNRLYFLNTGIKGIITVCTDHCDPTPLTACSTPIHITQLQTPAAMVASTVSNSIFVSDYIGICIWKIQLPNHEISQISLNSAPDQLSITPDNKLLAVMENKSLDIFNLEDLSRLKSIVIPFVYFEISCAAQLPNKNIVLSYSVNLHEYWICILTEEGDVVKKFGPDMFEPIQRWSPACFAVDDVGRIFIADSYCGRLYVFNSQMTDYHIISNIKLLKSYDRPRILNIKGRQQLLVCEESDYGVVPVSMFHLSPCNLIRGRSNKSVKSPPPASGKFRFKRKRKAKTFSAWNFQKIWFKKRRRLYVSDT